MPHPRRGLRVNGGSGRYYGTHGRASNPWAPRREGGRLGGGAGSGPVHPMGIGGAGELSDIMFGDRAAEPGWGGGVRPPRGGPGIRRARDAANDVMFHVPTANTYISLAVAAGATTRIRLLSAVVLLPLYPAALAAKMGAALDVASNGRYLFGVRGGRRVPEGVRGVRGTGAGTGRTHERGTRRHPPPVDGTGRVIRRAVQYPERLLDRPDADPVPAPHLGGGAARCGHAAGGPLWRRVAPLHVHPGAARGERREDPGIRRESGTGSSRVPVRALHLHPRSTRTAIGRERWP